MSGSRIVSIVEPEVLIDGEHKVLLECIILKPSMVISGKKSSEKATAAEVAEATVTVLSRTVPAGVPSINFLSGGQSPEQATQNLNLIHRFQPNLPWNVSFSYSRALQEPCLKL